MKSSFFTGYVPLAVLCLLSTLSAAWVAPLAVSRRRAASPLYMTSSKEEKLAKQVTGEELEIMLTEWEQPLVVDAYATWVRANVPFVRVCVFGNVVWIGK